MIKIYYYPFEGNAGPDALDSPLNVDGVGIEPERFYSHQSSSLPYHKCPAWAHKAKREFTAFSPRDVTLNIDFDNETINSPNTNIREYLEPIQNWQKTGTFQLHLMKFYIWTDTPNVWVEQKDCGLTSYQNNLTLVGGWWNLSDWSRLATFAFDVVDKSKPVVIKRGDPLFRFAFYKEDDLTKTFDMVKSTPTLEQIRMFEKRVNLKTIKPHLSAQKKIVDRHTDN